MKKSLVSLTLGSMSSAGEMKGLYDGSGVGSDQRSRRPWGHGFFALLMWRFAYHCWGMQTSIENKILIPMHWLKVR